MLLESLRTLGFAAAVCAVCSIMVSTAAVSLRERQEQNQIVDRKKNVLAVAGLIEPGERLSGEEVNRRFDEGIQPRVVELRTGEYAEDVDPQGFDQRRAAADPEASREAPANPAGVRRIPEKGLVYQVVRDGELKALIIPVEGKGLWSTLYGYLALGTDVVTIDGLNFYEHAETPGLGGEISNPRWQARWKGRKAFDEQGKVRITVIKGRAGPPAQDPYQVDGLAGATITAYGVSYLVRFWLGENGYGPYLEKLRREGV